MYPEVERREIADNISGGEGILQWGDSVLFCSEQGGVRPPP